MNRRNEQNSPNKIQHYSYFTQKIKETFYSINFEFL